MYTLEQIYEALGKIENGGTMVAYLQDAIRGASDEAAKNRIEKNKILDQLNLRQSGDTDGALKNLVATLTALQNVGGALSTLDTQMNGLKFQSTLLMRGATPHSLSGLDKISIFQSTLLMRGATVSLSSIDLLDFIIHFSRTQHLFPKTLLLTLCPVSSISCVMALRA